MSLPVFTIDNINLTSHNEVTGAPNTAHIYSVQGIDRELSIAELVIVLCLDRAAELEASVVSIMSTMSDNTRNVEELTNLEKRLVDNYLDSGLPSYKPSTTTYKANSWAALMKSTTGPFPSGQKASDNWIQYLKDHYEVDIDPTKYDKDSLSPQEIDSITSAMETRLDAMNTTSQETMIQLQSLTNKRDQTYDLITAMVKNTLTAATSVSANMR